VQQSRDISVSRTPQLVVSTSGNRSGAAKSVAGKKRQIAPPISPQIQHTRTREKIDAVSIARPTAKSSAISARTTPSLQRAGHGSTAPKLARAVRPAAVAPSSDRPLKNTRAMLQLGMLFGLAYVGFLVAWFWSTRFRRGVRRPLRL
jgi:hypothetical protein